PTGRSRCPATGRGRRGPPPPGRRGSRGAGRTPPWAAAAAASRSPRRSRSALPPAGPLPGARSQSLLVLVPGALECREVGAEEAREGGGPPFAPRLQPGVVAQGRQAAPPVPVQQEVHQRPGRAVSPGRALAAPEGVRRAGAQQFEKGDRATLPQAAQ